MNLVPDQSPIDSHSNFDEQRAAAGSQVAAAAANPSGRYAVPSRFDNARLGSCVRPSSQSIPASLELSQFLEVVSVRSPESKLSRDFWSALQTARALSPFHRELLPSSRRRCAHQLSNPAPAQATYREPCPLLFHR